MPTPDRTTLKSALQALLDDLRQGLQADPPTAAKPFRRIEAGDPKAQEYPRPFLALKLTQVQPVATTEGDRLFRANLAMRLVTDVLSAEPLTTLLDAIGAVEDYFDGLQADEHELSAGADGLDDRTWQVTYPAGTAASRLAEASCTQTLMVRVERGFNREPNP